jgi:hypothetical protein
MARYPYDVTDGKAIPVRNADDDELKNIAMTTSCSQPIPLNNFSGICPTAKNNREALANIREMAAQLRDILKGAPCENNCAKAASITTSPESLIEDLIMQQRIIDDTESILQQALEILKG